MAKKIKQITKEPKENIIFTIIEIYLAEKNMGF